MISRVANLEKAIDDHTESMYMNFIEPHALLINKKDADILKTGVGRYYLTPFACMKVVIEDKKNPVILDKFDYEVSNHAQFI